MPLAPRPTACFAALLLSVIASPAVAAVAVLSDDFNDNAIGSAWNLHVDNAARLTLDESSERLNVLASAPLNLQDDALYLSKFRLSTANDFEMRINYNFTGVQSAGAIGDYFGLTFGLGRDLDGFDSAAVGFGYVRTPLGVTTAASVAYRINDEQTTEYATNPLAETGGPANATFVIAYDAETDSLAFSRLVGVDLTTLATVSDVVGKAWQADDLLVSFGARGKGFSTSDGQAWFDDFSVVSGTLVPEPMSMGILIGAPLMLRRRRRS